MTHNTRNFNTNNQVLDWLFRRGKIELKWGALFEQEPIPLPPAMSWNRIEGMMLGLAIGDALGNTTESLTPQQRKIQYREIRDYLPNRYANYRPVGLPSDDTQLAIWMLEELNGNHGLNPERLAQRFTQGRIFGIGSTMKRFLRHYKSGLPWFESGPKSAGNGALMRIAPIVIPHLRSQTKALWVDTALAAMLTHNDSASNAACLGFVAMLWQLFTRSTVPEPNWWLETYIQFTQDLEIDSSYRPRGGAFTEDRGYLWQFVERRVSQAYQQGLSVREACDRWYSGAYLLETIPSVLYILMRYGDNPEAAMVRAVNDTKDNDTIAAIVGAAVGALHGKDALPQRWQVGLLGRTAERDDGKLWRVLEKADQIWWHHQDS